MIPVFLAKAVGIAKFGSHCSNKQANLTSIVIVGDYRRRDNDDKVLR
jgi:hypothetical protein